MFSKIYEILFKAGYVNVGNKKNRFINFIESYKSFQKIRIQIK